MALVEAALRRVRGHCEEAVLHRPLSSVAARERLPRTLNDAARLGHAPEAPDISAGQVGAERLKNSPFPGSARHPRARPAGPWMAGSSPAMTYRETHRR